MVNVEESWFSQYTVSNDNVQFRQSLIKSESNPVSDDMFDTTARTSNLTPHPVIHLGDRAAATNFLQQGGPNDILDFMNPKDSMGGEPWEPKDAMGGFWNLRNQRGF